MFTALGFLPEHRIRDAFAELKDASPETLTEFAQHFEGTYIGYFYSSIPDPEIFFRIFIAKPIFLKLEGELGPLPPPPLWIRPCQAPIPPLDPPHVKSIRWSVLRSENINFLINWAELMPVDVCRYLSIIFLDYLSRRYFVISIFCPLDILSVVVLSVFLLQW